MAADLPNFDPRVIERFAESAYRRANAIFVGCVTGGVMLGAMFGATPLTPLGAGWPIPPAFGFATMLAGAFLGGVIGYVVGDTRSALCRLQGQTALAQVESAKHATAMADAMREIHEIHEQMASAQCACTRRTGTGSSAGGRRRARAGAAAHRAAAASRRLGRHRPGAAAAALPSVGLKVMSISAMLFRHRGEGRKTTQRRAR